MSGSEFAFGANVDVERIGITLEGFVRFGRYLLFYRHRTHFLCSVSRHYQILRLRISYALVMDHLATRLQRLRLRRIFRVGVAERQNRKDRPSVLDAEHRANFGRVEVANPAGAE